MTSEEDLAAVRRLAEWVTSSPYNAVTLCTAGTKMFVRLGSPSRWKISEKEFPTSFSRGPRGPANVPNEDLIDAIGYGDSLAEAVQEAFSRLPG